MPSAPDPGGGPEFTAQLTACCRITFIGDRAVSMHLLVPWGRTKSTHC